MTDNYAIAAITALALLSACGPPAGDPSGEIIETSKGAVGTIVTLKTTPSLKSGSLSDAGNAWQSNGWEKVQGEACKETTATDWRAVEAYEITIEGYAAENIPTRNLRLCAAQMTSPKRIAAIGYVVSTEKAKTPKP